MNRLSAYFPLIIAALLAATTFWLEQVVRSEYRAGLGNARHDPDVIVHQATIDRFDAEGKRISRIVASRFLHYPDDDTVDLFDPVITLTRDARPTVFSSKTAHGDNASKIVVLRDQVLGVRAASADSPEQTLKTEELTVLTDDEIVRTTKPVFMTQGASTVSGIGAEWNNLTGVFTIDRDVRALIMTKAGVAKP
jgi:lipopolysaccharide export system protein LptC